MILFSFSFSQKITTLPAEEEDMAKVIKTLNEEKERDGNRELKSEYYFIFCFCASINRT